MASPVSAVPTFNDEYVDELERCELTSLCG